MTIETTINTSTALTNGVTTVFPFNFLLLEASTLSVQLQDLETGVITYIPQGAYVISGLGSPAGSVIFNVAPADGSRVIIQRLVPLTQPLDLINQSGYYPETVEKQLDRIVMQIQQLVNDVNRSLKTPNGEPSISFPTIDARKNLFLAFDAVGALALSGGTGADAGLRQDLGGLSGGSLVSFAQALLGSVTRTMLLKTRETVSVQDFGAVGDGAEDDTAAVQAAFDSGAGAIFVPRGEYIVDAVTAANIYLYGPGTIRKKPATKGAMINLTGTNWLESLTVDYDWENADQSPPNFGNASVEQVQGSLTVMGVKFIRSFDSAVYTVGTNLHIDSACSFTGGKPHNGLTAGDERPTYYVFAIADAETTNEVIDIGGAYFEGTSLDPDELHLNPTGIFITASAVDGYRFKAININNAVLIGCSTNAGNGNVTGAIDLYNGADNIVISGVTIRYFTYAGIKVQNSSYFSVTGNTLTDGSVPAGANTPHSNGIVTIEKARGSTVEQKFGVISSNIIDGCAYSGITNSCDYVAITDNVISRVATVADIATGINNAASHVTIANNVGTDVLGTQILTDGDHVRIIGNSISSGAGAADTAIRWTGNDITIAYNSLVSGTTADSTGIRTNGPTSNVRIFGNYVDGYPYGLDIRTSGGAVDKIVQGLNQIVNYTIAPINLGGAVTGATMVSTTTWS